jgi:hypothetical protein
LDAPPMKWTEAIKRAALLHEALAYSLREGYHNHWSVADENWVGSTVKVSDEGWPHSGRTLSPFLVPRKLGS